MVKVTIQVPVEVDDEFFDNLLCTAFEGGSNYWIDHVIINHPAGDKPKGVPGSLWASAALNAGGSVMIYPQEEADVYRLTKEKFVAGLQAWVSTYPGKAPLTTENKKGCLDGCNMDADDADCILQYALFKEVVFG